MSQLTRTTITIPEQVYTQARLMASSEDKSFSAYVSGILVQNLSGKAAPVKNPKSTLGVFSLGSKKDIYKKRSELYDKTLSKKVRV